MSQQPVTGDAQRHWPPLESDQTLRVYAQQDILHILGKIMDRAALVAAYFNGGNEFCLSTILGVSAQTNELFLEPGPDELTNKHLLDANKILLVTHDKKVKIKFTANHIAEAEFMGMPAYRIPVPEFLIRLQRREFFRIRTSVANPVLCCFRLGKGRETTAVLWDISVGGVSLIDNLHTLDFKPGDQYDDCYIELPGHGTLQMGLEIRNVAETETFKNGKVTRRAGCQFVNLSHNAESVVQRYIMSLEMSQDLRGGRRIIVKR